MYLTVHGAISCSQRHGPIIDDIAALAVPLYHRTHTYYTMFIPYMFAGNQWANRELKDTDESVPSVNDQQPQPVALYTRALQLIACIQPHFVRLLTVLGIRTLALVTQSY